MRVAILGLGVMGSGMARNVLQAGFPLTVYNRTPHRAAELAALGAVVAESPAKAAAEADVVLSMLADDDASARVWLGAGSAQGIVQGSTQDGALAAMRAGAVAIDCGTVSPGWIAQLAAAAAARGVALLEAPVTGSRPQANAGELKFLVGGDAAVLQQVRPVLASMSREILHLGPLGSGGALKLINNFLCGVQVASFAEALAWIDASGMDRQRALEFLNAGAPGSGITRGMSERMLTREPALNFALSLMEKDLRYAQSAALEHGVRLTMGAAADSLFGEAKQQGYGAMDMSAVRWAVGEQQ
ncbi:MAG: NAD(P)-dependent oxidoreductase [Acidobacteriota bacterium]|nr:NAD(P)-dependent oxidoreductase [Acidobacteriota bacterium]